MPNNKSDDSRNAISKVSDDHEHVLADDVESLPGTIWDSVTIGSDATLDEIVIPIWLDPAGESVADQNIRTAGDSELVIANERPGVVFHDTLHAVANKLAAMIAANANAFPARVFAGFRLLPTCHTPRSEVQSYANAFIPLRMATRFPELLTFNSLDYAPISSDEILPIGTRIVIRPGLFSELRRNELHAVWNSPLLTVIFAILAVAVTGLAIWMKS